MQIAFLQIFSHSSASIKAQERQSTVTYLPILFYTPETKFAFGGLVNYNFYTSDEDENTFPSTIMPDLIYTLNKQIIAELFSDIYFDKGGYHLVGRIAYQYFPDSFFGIGSRTTGSDAENFTARNFATELLITKKVFYGIDAGVKYLLFYSKITDHEEGKVLAQKKLPGSRDGYSSGFGVILNYDNRNNKFYPSEGSFSNISFTSYGKIIGSAHTFNRLEIDAKFYKTIWKEHILAVQAHSELIAGDPPFQIMPQLGGQNLLRGYYSGRFRDNNSMVFQSEYRFPLLWRFGAVVFAGVGDVFNRIEELQLNNVKYSFGTGLRFRFNEEEKLNIRLDIGFTQSGSGFYVTIAEAI